MARTATLMVSGLLLVLVFVSRASGGPEPSSRSEYAALFNRLSAEGCQACVAAGYGWSDARGRCGGFASMKCASQEVGVSQVEDEGEDEDDWLEGIDEDDDEETGGVAWKDTDLTTSLWAAISNGDEKALKTILSENSQAARVRARDGRGPLFWAYEYGMADMVQLLIS